MLPGMVYEQWRWRGRDGCALPAVRAVGVGGNGDLPALRDQYEQFLRQHSSDLAVPDEELTDEQAFAHYLRVIDSWRVFPRIDPGLPATLLPPDWPAAQAWSTFASLHDRWAQRGLAHVRAVVAG